ncbi:hypothetical protein FOA52_001118 [Chlamydomonas sp. UWO 241]|nr:hypothetical protein FOA52_001118 [Chlamydomonas sp. UWO 241]
MGSEQFTNVESFRLNLVDDEGDSRVIVQIGLSAFKVLDAASNRTMRSMELGHITRWQCRGGSLTLYIKGPRDVEEKQMTLEGNESVIRSALDTLTCSCMQLAELLQSKQSDMAQETANSLSALVAGNGKKKGKGKGAQLPTADEVEYWKSPDKAGWMQCQGEVMKSWRKRWFVLKSGFLFRFMTSSVTEKDKPRGVVDLSKVQDVKPGSAVTGKPNSIMIKTSAGGCVAYVVDTETELVEWVSAIETAMARIVRAVAGVDDEPVSSSGSSRAKGGGGGGGAKDSGDWMKQLERNMESFDKGGAGGGGGRSGGRADNASSNDPYAGQRYGGGGGGGGRSGGSGGGNVMVEVVGYDGNGGGGGGGGGGSYAGIAGASALPSRGGGGEQYGGGGGYGGGASGGASGGVSGGYAGPSSAGPNLNDTYLSLGAGSGGHDARYAAYYGAAAPAQQQAGGYGSGGYGCGGGLDPMGSSGYNNQPGAATAAAAPPMISLLDEYPQSAPAYPAQQQQASAPMQQQPQVHSQQPGGQQQSRGGGEWQVHYTDAGQPYYHNASTGSTQWEAPVGFA